ncbi:MAG: ankyrin repeat domain-containing protein, partial [Gemmatimonadales bacterium]
ARMYGGEYATMSMLVSSTPPAAAGVQVPLVEVLLDFGASADGVGSAQWGSNVRTALLFGFRDAAAALVARGAATNDLVLAAGLGRLADVRAMLADSSPEARHGALAMAAMLGQAAVVNALLDAGESPDRFNPDGMHAHGTPLHQAALGGHLEVVRLLVDRGARLDLRDSLWDGTPLGWAKHGEQTRVAELLEAAGAPE